MIITNSEKKPSLRRLPLPNRLYVTRHDSCVRVINNNKNNNYNARYLLEHFQRVLTATIILIFPSFFFRYIPRHFQFLLTKFSLGDKGSLDFVSFMRVRHLKRGHPSLREMDGFEASSLSPLSFPPVFPPPPLPSSPTRHPPCSSLSIINNHLVPNTARLFGHFDNRLSVPYRIRRGIRIDVEIGCTNVRDAIILLF